MKWEVPSSEGKMRLWDFLSSRLSSLSRRKVKSLIENGAVRVDGRVCAVSTKLINSCQLIEVNKAHYGSVNKKKEHYRVLFEDEDFLVLDKPVGEVCRKEDLQRALKVEQELFLVHRLDKDTSGLLLVAKNQSCLDAFIQLFTHFKVEKTYVAIVHGAPSEDEGACEGYYAKKASLEGQNLWTGKAVKGAYAKTSWECIERHSSWSKLYCYPKTGKTHQIRVHLAEAGMPIVGDRLYAKEQTPPFACARLCLHAYKLSFPHPIKEKPLNFCSSLPSDFS